MPTSKSIPKRHHTLPEHYQSGFAASGAKHIWIFDRVRKQMRRGLPHNTAVEGEFYSVESSQGAEARALETFLANKVEMPFWSVLRQLDEGGVPATKERLPLAVFCAFLLVRVPAFRDSVRYQFAQAIASYEDLALVSSHLDELFEKTDSGLLLPSATKDYTLRKMVELGFQIAKHLVTLDIHIMHSEPEERFITTDTPFGLVRMVDRGQRKGVMSSGFLKWVPLSGRTAVGFGEPGGVIRRTLVPPIKARRRNVALAAAASSLIIAGTEQQLRSIVAELSTELPPSSAFPPELE